MSLPSAEAARRRGGARPWVELVAQFQQQALGGLLADAGNLGQPRAVLARDGLVQFGDRHARRAPTARCGRRRRKS